MNPKIIVLGNEFIDEDSLARKICDKILDFEIIKVRDSFELMEELWKNEKKIILDVVENLKEPREITLDELNTGKIISAHDFDAGFVFRLFGEQVKIIGIPQTGDENLILEKVKIILSGYE